MDERNKCQISKEKEDEVKADERNRARIIKEKKDEIKAKDRNTFKKIKEKKNEMEGKVVIEEEKEIGTNTRSMRELRRRRRLGLNI